MDLLRWAEQARLAGRKAAEKGLSRDSHDYEPTSYALIFFHVEYDRTLAKRDTEHLVRVLNGSAQP